MSLSVSQYKEIMQEYDHIRTENYHQEMDRKEEIYEKIPAIRQIDETIAHISIETTKYMIFHPGEDKREELKKRIYELSMEKINQLAIHGYPTDYLDPIYRCKACKDTGYIGEEKCHCLKQRYVNLLYEHSNLNHILEEENFANFRLDYYSDQEFPRTDSEGRIIYDISPRDNIRQIYYECDQFIRTFTSKPGQNLLIYGRTGRGKTFLTNCVATEILRRECSVIYLTAYELFHELEEYTFNGKRQDTALPPLLTCDLLIIDDLGTELNNAFINTQLFHCINERIIRKKSTIINTNLSLELISKTYTERVSSRIIQHYKLLHVYGEDIRMKKAFSSLDETKQ